MEQKPDSLFQGHPAYALVLFLRCTWGPAKSSSTSICLQSTAINNGNTCDILTESKYTNLHVKIQAVT
jgi:hypothetical protein